MKRRIRFVLLPAWGIALFLAVYALWEFVIFLTLWRGGITDFGEAASYLMDKNLTGVILLLAASAAYGAYRLFWFHPLYRPAYRKWLTSTPWKFPVSLPLGPIHLVWQDALLLAIASLLMLRHQSHFPALPLTSLLMLPLTVAMIAYLIVLGVTFRPTGVPQFAWALAFGFGLLPFAVSQPVLLPAIVGVLYLVGYVGLRKSLKRFHEWDLQWYEQQGFFATAKIDAQQQARQRQLCWPFNRLGPNKTELRISYQDGILLGLLCGWWMHCVWRFVTAYDPESVDVSLRTINAVLCFFLVVIRLAIYCAEHRSPISLKGRLLTGRLIIPGYDAVLLAPIAIVLAWFITPLLLGRLHVPAEIGDSITCAAMFLVALNMGPTYERWQLTGNHRLVPVFQANSTSVARAARLTQVRQLAT